MITDAKARRIVSDILKKVDYDIWKSYFHPPSFEREEEEIKEDIDKMIAIVKAHVNKD